MSVDIYPLQMLLLTVSGWVHRHQADVIREPGPHGADEGDGSSS